MGLLGCRFYTQYHAAACMHARLRYTLLAGNDENPSSHASAPEGAKCEWTAGARGRKATECR
eukprot:6166502-Lingulodinium_polyedra.AAC.1